MKATPLTLRKKLALELWRKREELMCREHALRQLFWECTLRCNLHCRHCGSDCKKVAAISDMPKEDFLRVLDNVAAKINPSKVFVVISGGEPLMRNDLEECCAAIYKKGFPWGMVTNGFYLSQQRLLSLLKAGMHTMTISLDGLEEEHNWMRGNSESFKRVDVAISMLVSIPGFTFDIVTCVNRRNYGQLEDIKKYLIKKKVGRWRIFSVFPNGRAANDPDMKLTTEEFRGMFEFIRNTRKEGIIRADYGCEGFLGNYEAEVRDHFYTCQAGISVASVMADGSISACTSIRSNFSQGNIYTDDFMEVWENHYQQFRDREWMKTGQCAECTYWRYCKGNGMHLHDADRKLLLCHLNRLKDSKQ